MSFRKQCHMPFRKLIPSFTLTGPQVIPQFFHTRPEMIPEEL